jgi:two-component system OmpR family sensor kinase
MLKVESVRARLTLYYVLVLALALTGIGVLIYVLVERALSSRIEDGLLTLLQTTRNSLRNDLDEGQTPEDAARSTAAELASRLQMLAIYDDAGRLLAEEERDDDLQVTLPELSRIPSEDHVLWTTVAETNDPGDRHRLAIRRITITPANVGFIAVAGGSLEPLDDELEALREVLLYIVPLALMMAGAGGWFLARRSLAPVAAMADQARRIGVGDLSARLPVTTPGDELGRLASTFNDLLERLERSLDQQRQFMADASHELRTPVTTTRTAATVALQQPHRDEADYRETLAIVEQQAARLSRIVEDMFTLARADAGNYPVRREDMYLDEVVGEVVRAARVLAAARDVGIELRAPEGIPFTGDEDLIRRLVVNLLDNAVRYSPAGSTVRVQVDTAQDGHTIVVQDAGPGILPEDQGQIFERFYRVDRARTRRVTDAGAGLGLALARWIARLHGGDLVLTRSSAGGSTFTATLPVR